MSYLKLLLERDAEVSALRRTIRALDGALTLAVDEAARLKDQRDKATAQIALVARIYQGVRSSREQLLERYDALHADAIDMSHTLERAISERDDAKRVADSLASRAAAQSELLSMRAEKDARRITTKDVEDLAEYVWHLVYSSRRRPEIIRELVKRLDVLHGRAVRSPSETNHAEPTPATPAPTTPTSGDAPNRTP